MKPANKPMKRGKALILARELLGPAGALRRIRSACTSDDRCEVGLDGRDYTMGPDTEGHSPRFAGRPAVRWPMPARFKYAASSEFLPVASGRNWMEALSQAEVFVRTSKRDPVE